MLKPKEVLSFNEIFGILEGDCNRASNSRLSDQGTLVVSFNEVSSTECHRQFHSLHSRVPLKFTVYISPQLAEIMTLLKLHQN